MTTARVTELGVELPLTLLGQTGIQVGDDLQVTTANGEVTLRKVDPEVANQVGVAKQIMKERSDVLRRLAE
jgi:antitoxin component of MazEF toxin-antitoxin module